jgi:NADPH-dependent ferric siderophore reductase
MALFGETVINCPRCGSSETQKVSEFGSTPARRITPARRAQNPSTISSASEERPMAEQQFHELTISAVRPQTAHAKAIRFELPDALKAEFAFKPGQYLTLRTKLNGEDVRRSYSICCAPGEGLEIGVKHVEGGAFSSFAQGLEPGDRIEVAPPHGRFTAETGVTTGTS